MNPSAIEDRYNQIRADAERIAGATGSLRWRARGYLDVYRASNGACMFALVAASGALWASWYLICARLAVYGFALADWSAGMPIRQRIRQFVAYVDTLKDINRLVMIETYVLIHTIRELGPEFAVERGVPQDLVQDYHAAMATGSTPTADLREIYHKHFLWEQERVVSDTLDKAFEAFTWTMMRNICQRPWVWFGYFRFGRSMNFRRFTDQQERIEKGLIAFDRAVEFGVDRLDRMTALRLRILPGRPE